MLPNNGQQTIDNIEKETVKAIKQVFGNRIKQNFLLQMRDQIKRDIGLEIFQYYRGLLKLDGEALLKGNPDSFIEYEVCRNIVGVHRSNTIFMDDDERSKLQNDQNYRNKLSRKVIEHIRLRPYVGQFARMNQFIAGDEFLFFSVPYKLFAICINANWILVSNKNADFFGFYTMIFNKGLSALCLLENNMFDSIYPICRAIIEIYIKLLVLMVNPHCLSKYEKLCNLDLQKGCKSDFPDELNQMFNSRKYQKEKRRLDYLHYGWVDDIADYDDKVSGKRYSFYALLDYVIEIYKQTNPDMPEHFQIIHYLYDFCHIFTHGTVGNAGYPIVHYFNLVEMLGLTIEHSYRMLCEQLKVDTKINGVDVIKSINEDFDLMQKQSTKRSNENFEKYYKTFNCLTIK